MTPGVGTKDEIWGETLTILNESGAPDAVSPLHGLALLAEKLPDALLVVAGTRADAHLVQFLSGPLPGSPVVRNGFGAHPRVVFVILEPDEEPDSGALASRIVEAAAGFRRTGLVLLVACRSVGLLGMDASLEAALAERRLGLSVRAMIPDPETGGFVLSTDLEDGAIRALIELCPQGVFEFEEERSYSKQGLFRKLPFRGRPERRSPGERGAPRSVVLLGALPDPQEELVAELARVGVEVTGALPGAEAGWLPAVGEGTVVAAADPYLAGACRAAEERGATVVRTLLPIGVDGTARFVQDIAALAGLRTSEAGRARQVWEGLEPLRNRIRGRRIFFTGDTGLEVPLARFLAGAGAVVLEVGTPRLEKRFLAAELSALGEDVDVVESPEWRAQLDRIDSARPDLVVASPGLYVPLVARGHLCRSSLDFLSLGVHGYEGARRVLELFVRTFERAEGLDALNL
jgi:light-independent protochlorophyllide reductase subunit N